VPKVLSETSVEGYRKAGYHFPVRVLSATEADAYRRQLEAYEAKTGGPISGPYRHKSHLLFTWLDDLVRKPAVLDVVEDVLGPNLLCWSTSFFIKEQQSDAYVSWHQDATYWGLSSPDVMTVWIAFTPANLENGCMKFVPGTHQLEVVPHRDTFAKDNLLTRGQEIAVEVDEARGVDILLRAGEMSLHHVRMVHGSPANRSDDRRIGFAIRYIPTSVRQLEGDDSATLVRGVDHHHYFAAERPPAFDLAPEARAHHAEMVARSAKILYRGTAVERFR
jgi:Phytanoyl-CoA dioxygenase (PhyH)